MIEGRLLSQDDGRREAEVVVISDVLARALFPDGGAVGQRIHPGWNENGYEVVGVVGSVREFGVTRDVRPAFLLALPCPQLPPRFRFRRPHRRRRPAVGAALGAERSRRADPNLPLYTVMTTYRPGARPGSSR